ncbi:fumarate reductase subunit C [Kribbella turkmenica]|uniref:Fumarate reductase subunit C n=1 Tax=Kribbella turkmenica TaxID=2530375 RepID=A0A4R4XG99_9ACTN|nr:fumarate reductase subunit C [Kribbella turkmenica]TDD29826.1 fumarate reductase subunit C [Kribbella turkmenica]
MSTYQRPLALFWWLERRSYLLFVLRELSAVFVAWFVVYLLLLVNAVSDGAASYQEFLDWSGRRWVVAVNVLAMLFVLLHAITWFGLAPRAMVIRVRGRRLPPVQVVAAHYLAWLVLSAVVAWLVLR